MDADRAKELVAGFEITRCAMRHGVEMAFVAQDWTIDDPMEPHETRVFIFKPFNTADRQWEAVGLGTCRDMLVCPSYAPGERWLFVSGTGDVFVVADEYADFESSLEGGSGYIWASKSIDDAYCYFVGPRRKIIRRVSRNVTNRIYSAALDRLDLVQEPGFRDIDGFSIDDLYACGGLGDLWHYNGAGWHFVDLATNATLDLVCCGTNGKVHVLANGRSLFVGRADSWVEIGLNSLTSLVGDIEWYYDRLLIVTEKACYELVDNDIVESRVMANAPLTAYSYVSCYEQKIFAISGSQAAFFDGTSWFNVL